MRSTDRFKNSVHKRHSHAACRFVESVLRLDLGDTQVRLIQQDNERRLRSATKKQEANRSIAETLLITAGRKGDRQTCARLRWNWIESVC